TPLGEPGEEEVWESVARHAVQGLVAVTPVVEERRACAALDRVDGVATADLRGDLEATREDDAVDVVFDAAGYDPGRSDPFHPLGLRDVVQGDVGSIEGG